MKSLLGPGLGVQVLFEDLHWIHANWVTAVRDLPDPAYTSSSLAPAM